MGVGTHNARMEARTERLRIAQHMHVALRRWLGQGIDLERMTDSERYARDVLLVCDASKDAGLMELAQRYRACGVKPAHASLKRSSSPPSVTWSPTA